MLNTHKCSELTFEASFLIHAGPDDYVGGTYDVRFDANTTTAQLQIPINNDMICEEEEEFFGNLVIPAAAMAFGVRAGSKQTATVSILDDDSK